MASLVAEGPVRTIRLGHAEFESVLRERPGIALAVMRVLALRLAEATGRPDSPVSFRPESSNGVGLRSLQSQLARQRKLIRPRVRVPGVLELGKEALWLPGRLHVRGGQPTGDARAGGGARASVGVGTTGRMKGLPGGEGSRVTPLPVQLAVAPGRGASWRILTKRVPEPCLLSPPRRSDTQRTRTRAVRRGRTPRGGARPPLPAAGSR